MFDSYYEYLRWQNNSQKSISFHPFLMDCFSPFVLGGTTCRQRCKEKRFQQQPQSPAWNPIRWNVTFLLVSVDTYIYIYVCLYTIIDIDCLEIRNWTLLQNDLTIERHSTSWRMVCSTYLPVQRNGDVQKKSISCTWFLLYSIMFIILLSLLKSILHIPLIYRARFCHLTNLVSANLSSVQVKPSVCPELEALEARGVENSPPLDLT